MTSTITTSIVVPMVAAGVLTVRNVYPITLGANIGTTATALIASLAIELPKGLVIALVHLLFNLTAIALGYPVPQGAPRGTVVCPGASLVTSSCSRCAAGSS